MEHLCGSEVIEVQTSTNTGASRSTSTTSQANKQPISWTSEMEVLLVREVDLVNPFTFKERTKERGKAWDEVAENLNKHGYGVTKRAVRDKYKLVKEAVMKRNAKERRESGIAVEMTDSEVEMTQIVEELVEVEKEQKEQQSNEANEEAKKQTDGVEMRKRALETFSETNKRTKAEKEGKKKRNTGSDAAQFLMLKVEADKEFREREFRMKQEELVRQREREEKEMERRRQDEARQRERDDREEERRRREEEDREYRRRNEARRQEKEDRNEERRERNEAARDKKWETLAQQLIQQNQMLLQFMMQNQKKE